MSAGDRTRWQGPKASTMTPAERLDCAAEELAVGETESATAHALVAIGELLLELAQDERVSADDRDPYVRPL